MFVALDEATARDRDGTTVVLDDNCVRYRRRDRTLTVPVEYLYGEAAIALYASSIRGWDIPHRGELIGSIERQRILAEIDAALDALGVKHRVEV